MQTPGLPLPRVCCVAPPPLSQLPQTANTDATEHMLQFKKVALFLLRQTTSCLNPHDKAVAATGESGTPLAGYKNTKRGDEGCPEGFALLKNAAEATCACKIRKESTGPLSVHWETNPWAAPPESKRQSHLNLTRKNPEILTKPWPNWVVKYHSKKQEILGMPYLLVQAFIPSYSHYFTNTTSKL